MGDEEDNAAKIAALRQEATALIPTVRAQQPDRLKKFEVGLAMAE